MDTKRAAGIIMGVIGLFFLFLPVCWCLYMVIVPPSPSDYEYESFAGTIAFMLLSNIPGMISAGLTRLLLKRSTVFGVLFISLGLLNFYLLTEMFPFSDLFSILLYVPSIATIIVGVSLLKPPRMPAARQNIEQRAQSKKMKKDNVVT